MTIECRRKLRNESRLRKSEKMAERERHEKSATKSRLVAFSFASILTIS